MLIHDNPGGAILMLGSLLLLAAPLAAASAPRNDSPFSIRLEEGWMIQAADAVTAGGDAISKESFDPQGWHSARVPTTVMGALVAGGEYPDIFQAKNLEKVDRGRFQQAWWFRRELELPSPLPASVRLVFEGINYRANVWLNGKPIAFAYEIVGAFRIFDLDISLMAKPGTNVLAVEVIPPARGDYTIGFVDWNPRPPDENMGLFRPVALRATGPISLEGPFVQSALSPNHDRAALTVHVTAVNRTNDEASALVRGKIGDIHFEKMVTLAAAERRQLSFTPQDEPALDLAQPRLWWPAQYGEPNLYELHLEALVDGSPSDAQRTTFGIREIEDYLNEQGHRGYKINGTPILIRGGGWVDDLFLAEDADNLEAQLRYVRQMNLNTIRLEGFWGSSHALYDLADRYGILLMVGVSCQWEWESYLGRGVDDFGPARTEPEMELLDRYLADQVTWLRNHPSIFVWVLGSDMIPRPALERRYADTLAGVDPTRPYLGGCKARNSALSGPTAVKMEGPYDYVTPNYWYLDDKRGGAYGFNTETGPGPQPPPLSSLRRMMGEAHLWPIDDVWDYHCGRNEFSSLDRYRLALDHRYGAPASVEDFARVAQAANYEAIRAMFEAFAVNRPNATGLIQWMLNASWPKLYWQLYDYYLMPNGAFYGTRTGCQPSSLVYNYGDHAIYATNDLPRALSGHEAEVVVLDAASKEVLRKTLPVDLAQLSSGKLLDLSATLQGSPLHFVSLTLRDGSGETVARNFYWLSTKEDVPDWDKSTWFYTPSKEHADLTALRDLPKARVEHSFEVAIDNDIARARVTLHNTSDVVAFFIEAGVLAGDGGPVLPILWDDNYVSLLPGEQRTLTAEISAVDLNGQPATLSLLGFNLAAPEEE